MAGYDGDQHESIKSPRVRESFGLCSGELLFERGSDDVQFRPSLSKAYTTLPRTEFLHASSQGGRKVPQ